MTQPMVQKKICMLGGFSVGKTSLVKRFVESVFSETYLTTVGVKIDKKTVDLGIVSHSFPPINRGWKNGMPWMWSQCVWLIRMFPSSGFAASATNF